MRQYPETCQFLSKIIRQQNARPKHPVELIWEGKEAEAIALLNEAGQVHEINERFARAEAIAQQFAALTEADQSKTVVVCESSIERHFITYLLRHKLKETGMLGESILTNKLVSRGFRDQEVRDIQNYKEGDLVKFDTVPKDGLMVAGEMYRVMTVIDRVLQIERNGELYTLNPVDFQGTIEVMYAQDIAVGDRLRLTSTDKGQNRYKGQQLEVFEVGNHWIQAVDNDDRVHRIDASEFACVEHDWVGTSYKLQRKTAKYALLSLPSDPFCHERVAVGISQRSLSLQTFCENSDELYRWVQQSSPKTLLKEEFSLDELKQRVMAINAEKYAVTQKQAIADLVSTLGNNQGRGRGR
jgi:hypothetical protein